MHNVIPIILKVKSMKLMSQVHISICKGTRNTTFPGEYYIPWGGCWAW